MNQQVGRLEATVSKYTNLNDDRQNNSKTDRYYPVALSQDVSGYLDKCMGFQSKPPKLSLFSGKEVPGKHKISFNRWLFKMRTFQQSYAEPLVKEAIIRSVRG